MQPDLGGGSEEVAVDVRRARQPPRAVVVTLLVEHPEEEAHLGGRARGVGAHLVQGGLEGVAIEQAQVLGEHAPHRLQHEGLDLIGRRCRPVHQRGEDTCDGLRRLLGQLPMVLGEGGLDRRAGQEGEGVVAIWEVCQVERGHRRVGVGAVLPDLEAPEVADDDEPGSSPAACEVRGGSPGPLDLLLRRLDRHRRGLHLDQADLRPVQIHESGGRYVELELSTGHPPVRAVALEELVQEGLGLGLLGACVVTPAGHEVTQAALDLLAAGRQGQRSRSPMAK